MHGCCTTIIKMHVYKINYKINQVIIAPKTIHVLATPLSGDFQHPSKSLVHNLFNNHK